VIRRAGAFLVTLLSMPAQATGVRSFVALPVEDGGVVVRALGGFQDDRALTTLGLSGAYGITAKDTLLVGLPLRSLAAGPDMHGPTSVLYRRTLWQRDAPEGTSRFASLVGLTVPVEGGQASQIQVGGVYTYYRDRTQWDVDAIWRPERSGMPASGRYDIAWDFRLSPAEYPDWAPVGEWHLIAELNGRYVEGIGTDNRLLAAGRYTRRSWLLEFGVDHGIGGGGWGALLGFRRHL
jgi:hypothetical protein